MPWCYREGKYIDLILNKEEIIWSAGFFDGEGCCICIDRGKTNPELLVSIGQKHDYVLKRFKNAVAGIGKLYSSTRDGHRFQSHTFEQSQAVMAMIWKYLSPIKKEQYKIAIEKYLKLYNPNQMRRGDSSIGERRRQSGILKRIKKQNKFLSKTA